MTLFIIMEPNIAAVFQTHKSLNGTLKSAENQAKEKSTIDRVFEDLEKESESNVEELTNRIVSDRVESTLERIETNGLLKKVNLNETEVGSDIVTNLNKTIENTHSGDTANLMLHVDIAERKESIKTKDGIELADLLEDTFKDGSIEPRVELSDKASLLDMNETSLLANKTSGNAGYDQLKTENGVESESIRGEFPASFDGADLESALNELSLTINQLSSESNQKNHVAHSSSATPPQLPVSNQQFNPMSSNPLTHQLHNFSGDFQIGPTNIPNSHNGSLGTSMSLTSRDRTGIITEGTSSQFKDVGCFDNGTTSLASHVISSSPIQNVHQAHGLESEPNSLDGGNSMGYDDGLSDPSRQFGNADFQNELTESCSYQDTDTANQSRYLDDQYLDGYQNVDYSSGEFTGSGLHEEDLLSKYKQMEAQQELLNRSLMSLSTHFAQVQLRLKQIINSPKQEQESLLKNLEKFTFIGIPEVNELCLYNYEKNSQEGTVENVECKNYIEDKLVFEKNKHKEMIGKLKTQLESLENYVYEFSNNDDAEIPTSLIINKQQIIINELKDKLNLNLNLSEEEQLREEINKSIIGPMKTKEDLILQLKTQISDLEKFINFLQSTQCKCTVAAGQVDMKQKTITIMKKISTILHIFAEHHSSNFKKTNVATMKKSMKVNHYGDLRAQLEIAINHVIDACRQPPDTELPIDSDYMSDTEDPIPCNSKVALAVRKHLAPTLQRLLQHGLTSHNTNQTVSVVQYISCASSTRQHHSAAHIWDLIAKYYEIKDGPDFNCKPTRKLSESFNLDIGTGTLGIKQSLLASIGNILSIHHKYKKFNPDSYFKSFVCDGLNKKLLVEWLHVILTYKSFVSEYYAPWSYVATTRFTDAASSLRRLYEFHFSLTIVDVAIRNLQSIKDAF